MTSRTSIAVSHETQAALTRAMARLNTSTLDATVRALLFESECNAALARLDADPEALAEYRAEAKAWAEFDVAVPE